MRILPTHTLTTEVPAFRLVELLHVLADAACECLECEEPWEACIGCEVTMWEREAWEVLG